MGAWGALAFDNDTANDWAYGLDEVDDLSLVESALSELEGVGVEYAIDRIGGEKSELRELWDETDGAAWRETVDDLRRRLSL